MKLGRNTITREERDKYILFNGDNGCLIRLKKELFDELIIQNKKGHEKYPQVYDILFQNGFLEEKSGKEISNNNPAGNGKPLLFVNGFFSIKSHINPLNILWAMTPLCNLSCIYCLSNTGSHNAVHKTIPTKGLLRIADQLIASKVLRVTLSGGECLLIKDIWKIVKKLRDAGITVLMISNGTTISDSVIENLKKYRISIGISLDAPNEKINSITRGKNVFDKTLEGIRKIKDSNILLTVIVTITRYNFPFLSEHLTFLEKLGITSVNLQDLKPFGSRELYDKIRLTVLQERVMLTGLKNLIIKHNQLLINTGELFLFFRSNASGKIMQCPAGDNSAYINSSGDLYPCQTLSSFKMGNLLGGVSLADLWQNSDAVLKLREIKDMPIDKIPGCRSCSNKSRCEGGCRGDALFYSNDLFGLPSRCPKVLGLGKFSTKPQIRNENHISLCAKNITVDKADKKVSI